MRSSLLQAAFALPFSLRQRRLAKQRPPMEECTFVERIAAEGGDEDAARMVRTRLIDWVYVSGFTPYPDDRLSQIYGITEEELDDDLILQILRNLKIEPPTFEVLRVFGDIDSPVRIAQLVWQARLSRQ